MRVSRRQVKLLLGRLAGQPCFGDLREVRYEGSLPQSITLQESLVAPQHGTALGRLHHRNPMVLYAFRTAQADSRRLFEVAGQ